MPSSTFPNNRSRGARPGPRTRRSPPTTTSTTVHRPQDMTAFLAASMDMEAFMPSTAVERTAVNSSGMEASAFIDEPAEEQAGVAEDTNDDAFMGMNEKFFGSEEPTGSSEPVAAAEPAAAAAAEEEKGAEEKAPEKLPAFVAPVSYPKDTVYLALEKGRVVYLPDGTPVMLTGPVKGMVWKVRAAAEKAAKVEPETCSEV